MGLFDFLKPKEAVDEALAEKLKALGFTGTVEGSALCLHGPDGMECTLTTGAKVMHTPWGDVAGPQNGSRCTVKFRTTTPYKVLFSFSESGHFVNDPNQEGYRTLIDSLYATRSPAGVQNAILTFLVHRYQ